MHRYSRAHDIHDTAGAGLVPGVVQGMFLSPHCVGAGMAWRGMLGFHEHRNAGQR